MIVVFVSECCIIFWPEIIEKRLYDSKKQLFETMIAVCVGRVCCLHVLTAMTISVARMQVFEILRIGAIDPSTSDHVPELFVAKQKPSDSLNKCVLP